MTALKLKKAFLQGSAWTLVGMGAGQALRFGKNLILTRLLFPDVYGVMAIVWSIMLAINLMSDAGLEFSAIRHEKGDQEKFLNTIWTVKIVRGIFLFLLTVVLAYPASMLYGKSELLWLLPIAGLTSFLDGFSSTNVYLAKRKLQLKIITYIEVANEFASSFVTVGLSYLNPGYYSLVGGAVFAAFFHMTCSHLFVPGFKNKFAWDRESLDELSKFGRWVFLSSTVFLIYSQGDRIILGLYVSSATLGVYSLALMMSEVVSTVIAKLNSSVVYGTLSRVWQSDRESLPKVMYKIRMLFDGVFIFPAGILFVISDLVISTVYDNRYSEAGPILGVLSIRLMLLSMSFAGDSALLAMGKPKFGLLQNSGKALWLLLGVPVGYKIHGLTGAVIAISLTELPALAAIWIGLRAEKMLRLSLELRSISSFGIGILVGTLILKFVHLKSM
jgi:O-antigen/teichoic acid export membrane protein